MDIKVLQGGQELMKETLPLQSASRLYELQGLNSSRQYELQELNSNKWYEVKISYPASVCTFAFLPTTTFPYLVGI